ncbi:hypothetical protein AAG906_002248 [Vitis piasezkii]
MLVLRNIQEALDDPNWKVAVMEEMNDLRRSADGSIERYKLDIKNAFLNEDLEEEVFMNLPLGYKENLGSNKVCKLKKKSLYGLNQSPRACDKEELERLKRRLAVEFEIKDLGASKYFLGMEFARSKEYYIYIHKTENVAHEVECPRLFNSSLLY